MHPVHSIKLCLDSMVDVLNNFFFFCNKQTPTSRGFDYFLCCGVVMALS